MVVGENTGMAWRFALQFHLRQQKITVLVIRANQFFLEKRKKEEHTA